MKNRNWFCYSLDIIGLALLACAGLAIFCALWFAGAPVEPLMMGAFHTALKLGIGSLLLARSLEIANILRHESRAEKPVVETFTNDNVEQLPKRDVLPRAA